MMEQRYQIDESAAGGVAFEIEPTRSTSALFKQAADEARTYATAAGAAVVVVAIAGSMMWTKKREYDILGTIWENLSFAVPRALLLAVPLALIVLLFVSLYGVWKRRRMARTYRISLSGGQLQKLESRGYLGTNVHAKDETILDIQTSEVTDRSLQATLPPSEQYEVTVLTEDAAHAVGTGMPKRECDALASELREACLN